RTDNIPDAEEPHRRGRRSRQSFLFRYFVGKIYSDRSAPAEAHDINDRIAGRKVFRKLHQCFADSLMSTRAVDAAGNFAQETETGSHPRPVMFITLIRPVEPNDVGIVFGLGLIGIPSAIEGVQCHVSS